MTSFKNKLGEVHAVKKHFSTIESWLRVRTKVRDSKCNNCKTLYVEQKTIALTQITGNLNSHICESCADEFIKLGAKDIHSGQTKIKLEKDLLIADILSWDNSYKLEGSHYSEWNLKPKKLDKLQVIHTKLKEEREKEAKIQKDIEDNFVETETEQYLIDDWDIYESKYLKHELHIESNFIIGYHDFFDCGQGYYEDEIVKIVKIGANFYNVTIKAEIYSSKQDRGDRLYWVESIQSVTYAKIDKPLPKEKITTIYTITTSKDNQSIISKFLKNYE